MPDLERGLVTFGRAEGLTYLLTLLDLVDGCGIERARVGIKLVNAVDLVDAGGITAGQAARVHIGHPGQMVADLAGGNTRLERDDVLAGDDLPGSLVDQGGRVDGEDPPEEESDLLEANHGKNSETEGERGESACCGSR